MPHLGTCAEPDGRTVAGHEPREPPMTHSLIRTSPLRRFTRWIASPRVRARLASTAMLVALASCARGDVGAPCNHGDTDPPQSKLVTFPALSCNELLCVYADIAEAPTGACTVGQDGNAECNEANPALDRFQCVADGPDSNTGECQLKIEYVLERSMCSKKCSNDSDCKDGGPTQKVVVEGTNCSTGFACARIQTLGKFCCEKLCVCRDDLDENTSIMIDEACSLNDQEGCCDQDPVPEACGP
jgi:hypothetical protein